MITISPNPEDVKEAIRLKCANCYGALAMCNRLGGTATKAWDLCHSYSLKDLLEHAKEANIDLKGIKAAVDNTPIEDSLYYKRATGIFTEEEFQTEFCKWKNGK
jgi:hypothetical protein